jgi:hypothetical protein
MGKAADHAMVPAPTLTKAVDQLVAATWCIGEPTARTSGS